MTTIAALGIKITSDDAAVAADNLDRVTSSAADAEAAAAGTEGAFKKAGAEFEEFAKHARAHTLSLLQANESTRAFTGILARLPLPMLAAAAAFGLYEYAASKAAGVNDALARSIAQSNNAAGTTVAQLSEYAEQIGRASGSSDKAAASLGALVATGKVGADNLKQFGQASLDAQKAFGVSAQDIAKNFADIADAPIATLGALHALTPALQQQIEGLEKSGDAADAATIAQKAYANQLESQVQTFSEFESTYTRGWETIKKSIDSAFEHLLSPPPLTSLQKQLDDLKTAAAARPSSFLAGINAGPLFGSFGVSPDPNAAKETALQYQIDQEKARVAQAAQDAKDQQQLLRDNAVSVVAIQAQIEQGNVRLAGSIQTVTNTLAEQYEAIQHDNTILEALHSAGLISDTQYYDQRRALIEADTQTQVSSLNKQIELIRQETQLDEQRRQQLIDKSKDDSTPQGAANTRSLIEQGRQADLEATTRIAGLQAQANAKLASGQEQVTGITVQQTAAAERLKIQIQQLVDASQLYVENLRAQYSLQEASVTLGDKEAQQLSTLADIQQHFAEARIQIAKQAANNPSLADKAAAGIAAQNAAEAQAVQDFQKHYETISDLQGNWLNGAKKAFADYADAGANVANLTDQAFTSAFNSIEDSLVTLATTGKFSFKTLANSILADLVRIEAKILESQALQWLTGALTGPSSSNVLMEVQPAGSLMGLASGGPVSAGTPYIVGEKGQELFVPKQAGTIIPNGKWQGMGGSGVTINQVINAAPGTNVAELQWAMKTAKDQAKSEIYNSISRGEWKPALIKGTG